MGAVYVPTAEDFQAEFDEQYIRPLHTATGLDPTGATDSSAALQAQIDALGAEAFLDGMQKTIYIQAGEYRIETDLVPADNVFVFANDQSGTIFYPIGYVSCFKRLAPTPDTWDNMWFEGFTIDGQYQTNPQGNMTPDDSLGAKGFWIQDVRNLRVRYVTVKNIWATGIGCGYLQDGWIEHCIADYCGRGATLTGEAAAGAGAGIANGTGRYKGENCTYSMCSFNNNRTNGAFFENKVGIGSEVEYARGCTVIGCIAAGNYIGFKDAGCEGLAITGSQGIFNIDAGCSLHRTGANTVAGKGGLIDGCFFGWNGFERDGETPTSGKIRAGLVLGAMSQGGYTISNTVIDGNGVNGVYTLPGFDSNIAGPVKFVNVTVRNHDGSGALLNYSANTIKWMEWVNCDIYDNGKDAAQTYRSGVTILAATLYFRFVNNRCIDTQAVRTQQYALELLGGATCMASTIEGNDFRGNAVASAYRCTQRKLLADGTPDTTDIATLNLLGEFPAVLPHAALDPDQDPADFRDEFNRANNTDTLGGTWVTIPASEKWVIANNQAQPARGAGDGDYPVTEEGAADVIVSAQLGAYGFSDPRGGVILRATGTTLSNANYIRGGVRSGGMYAISEVTGLTTNVPDGGQSAVAYAPGDIIDLEANGTTITLYVNDVQVAQVESSHNLTATRVGLVSRRRDVNFVAFEWFRWRAL